MRYRTLLAGAIIYLSCIACAKKTYFSFGNSNIGIKALQEDSAVAFFEEKKSQEIRYSDSEPALLLVLSDSKTVQLPARKIVKEKEACRQFAVKNSAVNKQVQAPEEIIPEKKVNYFTLFLLAAFFPPLAVGIKKDFTSWQFFLTLGLTLSLFFPGMVYAIITILLEKGRE